MSFQAFLNSCYSPQHSFSSSPNPIYLRFFLSGSITFALTPHFHSHMDLKKLLSLTEGQFHSFLLKSIGFSFFDQKICTDLMIQFTEILPCHESIYQVSNDSMSEFFQEICSFLQDFSTRNSFYLLHSIYYRKNSSSFYFYRI